MKLVVKVGKELSLPSQISPPYSHQSQSTVVRFRKTLYGQVRAIKLGLAAHPGIHPDSTAARIMPWIIRHAVFTINSCLIRQDGKTSYERVFNKGSFRSFGSLWGTSSGPCSIPAPLPKASFEVSASDALLFVDGQMCHHWMRIVAHSGHPPRTVTRLIEEQQVNSVQFSKFTLPPHACESDYQEPQEDRIVLQELLRSDRSFIMLQKYKS